MTNNNKIKTVSGFYKAKMIFKGLQAYLNIPEFQELLNRCVVNQYQRNPIDFDYLNSLFDSEIKELYNAPLPAFNEHLFLTNYDVSIEQLKTEININDEISKAVLSRYHNNDHFNCQAYKNTITINSHDLNFYLYLGPDMMSSKFIGIDIEENFDISKVTDDDSLKSKIIRILLPISGIRLASPESFKNYFPYDIKLFKDKEDNLYNFKGNNDRFTKEEGFFVTILASPFRNVLHSNGKVYDEKYLFVNKNKNKEIIMKDSIEEINVKYLDLCFEYARKNGDKKLEYEKNPMNDKEELVPIDVFVRYKCKYCGNFEIFPFYEFDQETCTCSNCNKKFLIRRNTTKEKEKLDGFFTQSQIQRSFLKTYKNPEEYYLNNIALDKEASLEEKRAFLSNFIDSEHPTNINDRTIIGFLSMYDTLLSKTTFVKKNIGYNCSMNYSKHKASQCVYGEETFSFVLNCNLLIYKEIEDMGVMGFLRYVEEHYQNFFVCLPPVLQKIPTINPKTGEIVE